MMLDLNWSFNVIFGLLLAGIAYFPMVLVMLRIYMKWRARYAIFWAFIILLIIGFNVASCFGSIYSIEMLGTIGLIFLFSSNFLIVLFIDSVNRDTVDPVKICAISIMWAIASIALIISLNSSEFQGIVADNLLFDIVAGACAVTILFLPGCLVSYHGLRIYRHVPKALKSHAGLFLAGGIMIIFTSFLAIFDMDLISGVTLSGIVMLTAILSITAAFTMQPKLAYILPFKALRLTVVDTGSGLPIFTYTWKPGQGLVDEFLFSGMLQGISVILKESVNRGNVQEISMDNGIMILQRTQLEKVACVLVATKSSRTLRDGLQLFAKRFYEQFSEHLGDELINKEYFDPASTLVTECFPFLPE